MEEKILVFSILLFLFFKWITALSIAENFIGIFSLLFLLLKCLLKWKSKIFVCFLLYTPYRKPSRPLLAPSGLIFCVFFLQEQSPSLEDCLKLLKGERDEQRLAGLLLVTKFCKGDDNVALHRVYNAVGSGFLDRLLRTGKFFYLLLGNEKLRWKGTN